MCREFDTDYQVGGDVVEMAANLQEEFDHLSDERLVRMAAVRVSDETGLPVGSVIGEALDELEAQGGL